MSIFGMFKDIAGNLAGIKMLQAGSDVLINRHTQISTFFVKSAIRKHANEVIKDLFLRGFMEGHMRVEEAALIKLAVFYKAAEQAEEQQMTALLGDSISKIRRMSEGKIRAEVSLQVMGDTGH